MKRLALLLTIVLVSLVGTVGVSQGADPAVQSIAYQLQSIQAKLDALQPKQYFLTNKTFKGDEANDAACGPGYHFASIFEILDPTALQYAGDNPLAIQFPSGLPMDLGQGPPTYAAGGWVHTGFHTESAGLGNANCEAWTSNAGNTFGTSVSLSSLWLSSQTCDRIAPWWVPQVATCDGADTANTHLWCVSN